MAKYDPLARHLKGQNAKTISLDFSDIEKIIATTLPKSARQYREWWANERANGSHVQSKAWLSAGFLVDTVDLVTEHVTLQRDN